MADLDFSSCYGNKLLHKELSTEIVNLGCSNFCNNKQLYKGAEF
jgi:hypothetical protein